MAMANMNLIGVFVTKLWPVQALACGGGGGDGGATKNIISPKFSYFGDIIILQHVTAILSTQCNNLSFKKRSMPLWFTHLSVFSSWQRRFSNAD